MSENPLDRQEGGNHYQRGEIQPVEFITANKLSFLVGNIIKYLVRFPFKGTPLQDLEKARHYLDMLIEDVKRRPQNYGLQKDDIV